MNNEDAIVELKIIRDVYADMRKEYKTCVEALNMAIEVLSAEPKKEEKNCDDDMLESSIRICKEALSTLSELRSKNGGGRRMSDFYIKNEQVSVFGGRHAVGYIKIADNVFIQAQHKPFIIHRFMMRMFFGWKWVKDWHNEAEE